MTTFLMLTFWWVEIDSKQISKLYYGTLEMESTMEEYKAQTGIRE